MLTNQRKLLANIGGSDGGVVAFVIFAPESMVGMFGTQLYFSELQATLRSARRKNVPWDS